MKKLLSVVAVMFVLINSFAQPPFSVYEPVVVPHQSQSYSLPYPDIFSESDEMIAELIAIEQANKIVSSNLIATTGINIISGVSIPLKLKVLLRKNGKIELNCIGIKKNGKWSSCNNEVISLEAIYQAATKESEKTQLLELMEYGNYILIINPKTDIYIIE